MSKYAKKIVIRVFRENSWSENRVFMASIRRKKKRHAIISQEINTETNQMKDWTRKRKIDFIIGVALQIYFLFPWIQHYTIYGYLYNVLKMNDYVQMYNETILPSLRESWNYTKMTAFVFLVIIILIALFQLTELARIYHILKNEQSSDYRGFFWIIYLAIFSRFFEKFAYVDPIDNSLIPIYVEIYICVLLVFIGLWILIDAMLDTWEAEHQILISQLEEQEKHALQTKVKILEERYQEMLKSRKVVHDMKNHILALKNYDQEQNWSGLHEYLNELSDDMLEYNFHIWTGNHMLDMLLNQKEKDAQNQNTVMQIDTEVFSTLPFTDREIISLFGNLLDNALEACEKINDKERWIKIKIKKKNLLLYIEIANALEEMPKQIQKELVSIVTYWGQIGYTIPTALGIITAVIFTLFGCRLYLEKLRKQKNKYYKKILWLDNWYDQFFSHANISYIVSAFLIVILFGFNIVLVDNLPVRQPENYPYDIVWGANTKDKAFIEKLKEKYNVQTEFIPSIRVTSGNCAEHTGISATEYKRLTGKQVHLKNDEIYVIYQWDRSEYGTIGLDFGKLKPRLYTGCATADIWIYTARTLPGNKFTRKYTIKGNDRRIITGNFKTRVLSTSNMNTDVFEDIIVFSDHEYDKISQKAKGSNLTVLMNVAQNYDAVVNKIANYAAKHSQINFFDYHDGNLIYDKKPCTIENQENRMLNVSAMLIDMLVLFISIIFILLEKISSDYEALEWKYLFYYRTGMPEKKRRKNIYKEITMTSKVALITGMFIAAVMILVKILYKKMPVYWTKIYLAEAAVMIIGMTAIIMIIIRIAAWRSFKHSERRNKDE